MSFGVVMLDVEGTALNDEDRRLLAHPQVGGLILFTRNFESIKQLQLLVASIRECKPDMVIAVDHEGGRVQRFRQGFSRIPPMQSFLSNFRDAPDETLAGVKDMGWLMASELLACDIDISFAPVLDVDDHHCKVISDRSFSPNPNEVAVLADAFVRGMHEAGMAVTGKHYPGHGSVTGDSHLIQPIDTRPLDQITKHDLVPFEKLIDKLDAIMPAHIVFPEVDVLPVGFSPLWLQEKLRGELRFDGVIFSDDLTMAGAESAGSFTARADAALAAGCDMVLVCNNRVAASEVVDHLARSNVPKSDRLARMRMRKRIYWDDLRQDVRWQKMASMLPAHAIA